MPVISIKSMDRTIEYTEGSLMELLVASDLFIDNPCNGKGVCGKCRVRILTNAPEPTEREKVFLSEEELAGGIRLSCMVKPACDMEIELLHANCQYSIMSDGYMPDFEFVQYEWIKEIAGDVCGVAIDIGTTTVVCSLVNLRTGDELATSAAVNSQNRYGMDVITRITYEIEHPEIGADHLQKALISSINEMIRDVCDKAGIEAKDIYQIAIGANTTMMHTLLGVDATSMGKAPFTPSFTASQDVRATELGIDINPDAKLYCLPGVSAYIGADVVAGAYVCDLRNRKGNVLFVDIGTNGEIVLAREGELLCCSCAAGPALEGMNISAGMRASVGAIEDVKISDGKVEIKVIGDEMPEGICGSGILAAVKELLACGAVRPNGAFVKLDKLPEGDFRRLMLRLDEAGRREFVISSNPEIIITQNDIRQVQLAKGAILSGFVALLNQAGLEMKDLDEVIIAGQFGAHLPSESLIGTGILPAEVKDRITYVGNTSKTGAYMALMSKACRIDMEELSNHMEYMELGKTCDYENLFAECLMFPMEV